MKLLVPTQLPADLEHLVRETIGSCIAVHRELGPGLVEAVHPRAVAVELQARGIDFELERSIPVKYRDRSFAIKDTRTGSVPYESELAALLPVSSCGQLGLRRVPDEFLRALRVFVVS